MKRTFSTADTHSQTWRAPELQEGTTMVDFVGRMRAVPLEESLASAPGPEEFKITDLTHEEMQAFLHAMSETPTP